jgi:hypothetical protein
MDEVETERQQLIKKKEINKSIKKIITDFDSIDDFREILIKSKLYLTSQSYGDIIESQIKKILNISPQRDEISGDGVFNNKTIEIKVSIEGTKSNFNFVQLRPSHNVDYYLLLTYSYTEDDLFFFLIPHEDMITLIGKYAGYAHGTIKKQGEINRENVIKNLDKDYEYAIRPDYLKEEGSWKELKAYIIDIRKLKQLI